MSKKITTYFESSNIPAKRRRKESNDEIKSENLTLLQHDHGYCAKLKPESIKLPKEGKKYENKTKILTPTKCISTVSVQTKKNTRTKSVRKRLPVKKTTAINSNATINKSTTNSKQTIKDYFPVRRSIRKCHSNIMKEKRKDFEEAVLSQREDGLMVETFSHKGRGVRATKHFRRGDFVVEYSGELIEVREAKRREKIYATDENTGCYMYYFTLNDKQYCVDATAETKRMGRLINHSRHGNLTTKPFLMNDVPHLILIAKQDIEPGEELLYDYGDRNKTSLLVHPWLAK